MKIVFVFVSVTIASGLLLVNLYTSLVDVRSWGSDVPNSIAIAREYFRVVNPGTFFRTFSPVNQLLGLVALIVFWRTSPPIRLYLGIALVMYVLVDVVSIAYFFPRNDIMFITANLSDVELLKRTVSEWSRVNWFRSLILSAGIFFSFLSVHRIYSLRLKKQ